MNALAKRLADEVTFAAEQMAKINKPTICIFGGARVKPESAHYQSAVEVAKVLAENGFAVVTGGGPGIMEAGNKGAKLANIADSSVGLNIILPFEAKGNDYQDLVLNFNHFASRKVTFCRNAKGFVFFAGGYGTIDELGEVLTLIQCQKNDVVPVVLFGTEFWKGFVDWSRNTLLAEGLISEQDINERIIVTDDPMVVLEAMKGDKA